MPSAEKYEKVLLFRKERYFLHNLMTKRNRLEWIYKDLPRENCTWKFEKRNFESYLAAIQNSVMNNLQWRKRLENQNRIFWLLIKWTSHSSRDCFSFCQSIIVKPVRKFRIKWKSNSIFNKHRRFKNDWKAKFHGFSFRRLDS